MLQPFSARRQVQAGEGIQMTKQSSKVSAMQLWYLPHINSLQVLLIGMSCVLQDVHKVNFKDIFKRAWEEEQTGGADGGGLNLGFPILF